MFNFYEKFISLFFPKAEYKKLEKKAVLIKS